MSRRFKHNRPLRQAVKRMPCFVCGSLNRVDPCHVKTFGSSGIDAWWNLVPMCRGHHDEQHRIGWKRMCEKYPKVEALLKELGWHFVEAFGKFWLKNEKENEF